MESRQWDSSLLLGTDGEYFMIFGKCHVHDTQENATNRALKYVPLTSFLFKKPLSK